MHIPAESEIRAHAVSTGLVDESDDLTHEVRKIAIQQLLDGQKKEAAEPPALGQTLITRSVVERDDGHLIVEVWHKPKENRAP